ncbi:MAG: nucleoside triphosphate pyrophosphohydrolase [Bacteroidales bacterium]|jgi:XTP/dITP diphosphohydrolase|nr:nucleoside triphosphate pyrophosphohydrolase [Bacteroidales bacterium]NCU36257.1 nucleoside triphosphate pyrophosphohydrolase [Candidatus Falkowbacteria bacterium]MDD3525478.1 nucleoside triphosphate pyrophosphohydrolase [Bacteroidales bacterium]MDD4175875.1 nucleoside triphosphate pyrophosphohydrolase [Bacteroidales bacterium]MDD4740027.1 nucleoside triphosphate pyrophosphohydrolase [Bacteroidales bacterium]
MDEKLAAFGRLLTIMDELRAGCPWDKKQTFESLRYLTIEETYELSDAILENNPKEICKELGDLMLHLVFYARIGSETGDFDIKDVLDGIAEKLIARHPHIYSNVQVAGDEDVKNNWEKIKLKEKGRKTVLGGVPNSLPAMVKAFRMQEKARGVGFDWKETEQVWEKVNEEIEELQQEVARGDAAAMEKEFGDLLFSLVNYARFIGVNPEDALERTNRKFLHRFNYIEEQARKNGNALHQLSLEQMDALWNQAKREEEK